MPSSSPAKSPGRALGNSALSPQKTPHDYYPPMSGFSPNKSLSIGSHNINPEEVIIHSPDGVNRSFSFEHSRELDEGPYHDGALKSNGGMSGTTAAGMSASSSKLQQRKQSLLKKIQEFKVKKRGERFYHFLHNDLNKALHLLGSMVMVYHWTYAIYREADQGWGPPRGLQKFTDGTLRLAVCTGLAWSVFKRPPQLWHTVAYFWVALNLFANDLEIDERGRILFYKRIKLALIDAGVPDDIEQKTINNLIDGLEIFEKSMDDPAQISDEVCLSFDQYVMLHDIYLNMVERGGFKASRRPSEVPPPHPSFPMPKGDTTSFSPRKVESNPFANPFPVTDDTAAFRSFPEPAAGGGFPEPAGGQLLVTQPVVPSSQVSLANQPPEVGLGLEDVALQEECSPTKE